MSKLEREEDTQRELQRDGYRGRREKDTRRVMQLCEAAGRLRKGERMRDILMRRRKAHLTILMSVLAPKPRSSISGGAGAVAGDSSAGSNPLLSIKLRQP